ncbi:phage baseplate assembly protein V [Candidatus Vondammii sp. HM_W22]|uniref:phage baseplate assembly protein V n=1 Tax=Candidatus Vondammii sp. HM_W22 TaxID=2687299 RepID=UPI001F13D986|nr:phage baseplate assembly protein V [Candidatus Vondammii sp. HM_W22]
MRVKSGELLTDWLPWPAEIVRNFKHWRPLRTGIQVVLECPSGDPAKALIIFILYSSQLDALSTDQNIDLIQFNDGTELYYDSVSHHMQINVAGSMTINCSDDFIVTA